MEYLNPIGQVATGTMTLTSTPQAAEVKGSKLSGVHAIEIYAETGNCYYGDKTVTTSTGFPILQGTTKILPVTRIRDNIYLVGSGKVRIATYTE